MTMACMALTANQRIYLMKLDFGQGTFVHDMHIVDRQYTDTIEVPKGMHVFKCGQMFLFKQH